MSAETSFMIPGCPGRFRSNVHFPGDQSSVAPQGRVRCHDGRHLPPDPATKSLALHRESSTLVRMAQRAPRPGAIGLIAALDDVDDGDVLQLTAPLDPEARRLLFRAAAAVLANSGHEPFGLVGLEAMAAAGVARTGISGEDYARPGNTMRSSRRRRRPRRRSPTSNGSVRGHPTNMRCAGTGLRPLADSRGD